MKTLSLLLLFSFFLLLGDFGFARIRHESMSQSKLSQVTQTGGSMQYAAPELLNGFEDATSASDVYALAIVMWEVMTLREPYQGVSPDRIASMVPQGKRLSIPADMHPKIKL